MRIVVEIDLNLELKDGSLLEFKNDIKGSIWRALDDQDIKDIWVDVKETPE